MGIRWNTVGWAEPELYLEVDWRNPLGKTGKGLSWQGEEHAKLKMRE